MFSVILDRVLHLLYKDHSHSAQIHYAFPVAVVLWGKTMTVQLTAVVWKKSRTVCALWINNDWQYLPDVSWYKSASTLLI